MDPLRVRTSKQDTNLTSLADVVTQLKAAAGRTINSDIYLKLQPSISYLEKVIGGIRNCSTASNYYDWETMPQELADICKLLKVGSDSLKNFRIHYYKKVSSPKLLLTMTDAINFAERCSDIERALNTALADKEKLEVEIGQLKSALPSLKPEQLTAIEEVEASIVKGTMTHYQFYNQYYFPNHNMHLMNLGEHWKKCGLPANFLQKTITESVKIREQIAQLQRENGHSTDTASLLSEQLREATKEKISAVKIKELQSAQGLILSNSFEESYASWSIPKATLRQIFQPLCDTQLRLVEAEKRLSSVVDLSFGYNEKRSTTVADRILLALERVEKTIAECDQFDQSQSLKLEDRSELVTEAQEKFVVDELKKYLSSFECRIRRFELLHRSGRPLKDIGEVLQRQTNLLIVVKTLQNHIVGCYSSRSPCQTRDFDKPRGLLISTFSRCAYKLKEKHTPITESEEYLDFGNGTLRFLRMPNEKLSAFVDFNEKSSFENRVNGKCHSRQNISGEDRKQVPILGYEVYRLLLENGESGIVDVDPQKSSLLRFEQQRPIQRTGAINATKKSDEVQRKEYGQIPAAKNLSVQKRERIYKQTLENNEELKKVIDRLKKDKERLAKKLEEYESQNQVKNNHSLVICDEVVAKIYTPTSQLADLHNEIQRLRKELTEKTILLRQSQEAWEKHQKHEKEFVKPEKEKSQKSIYEAPAEFMELENKVRRGKEIVEKLKEKEAKYRKAISESEHKLEEVTNSLRSVEKEYYTVQLQLEAMADKSEAIRKVNSELQSLNVQIAEKRKQMEVMDQKMRKWERNPELNDDFDKKSKQLEMIRGKIQRIYAVEKQLRTVLEENE